MALIHKGEIIEARVLLDGYVRAGSVVAARLKQAAKPTIAVADDVQYLLPRGASGVSQGAALNIEVTREPIPGSEPWKRPLAKVTDEPVRSAPVPEARELAFPAASDALAASGWNDL